MSLFDLISILMVVASIFSYFNARLLKLPDTVGLFLIGILFSLFLLFLGNYFPNVLDYEQKILKQIDFQKFLMDGILSLLLFAGALKLDLQQLKSQRWPIIIFATVGTLITTFIVGFSLYYILLLINLPIPLSHALIFGALISPTDPVAILGVLNKTAIAKSLEIKISGESLFNDGVGYVLFLSLSHLAMQQGGGTDISLGEIGLVFLKEVGGAVLFGYLMGRITAAALLKIDEYKTQVLITLAMVMGGYTLAGMIGVSGPITMVVGGIMIVRSLGGENPISSETKDYVKKFWELVDGLMNAILFLLIGLKILDVQANRSVLITGCIAIILVLLSRFLSLKILMASMRKWIPFEPKAAIIMTWGGLRGGISIAMAISLADGLSKNLFIGITYIVVLFSILAQSLTLEWAVKKFDLGGENSLKI